MKKLFTARTERDALLNLWIDFNDTVKRRCSDCRFCQMAITEGKKREIQYLCVVSARHNKTMDNAYYELPCSSFKFCGWLAKFRRERAWGRFADDIDRILREEGK